jgi:CrcB protein
MLLVGFGGFAGSIARYVIAREVGTRFPGPFPVGTFLINISGSFLIGLLIGLIGERATAGSQSLRLLIGVGFLGGYTTFSAFEFESHALFENGAWLSAVAYMFGSLFVGLMAVRAGSMLARILV